MQKRLRIAVITNIIPIYRQGFYDRLFKRDDIMIKLYCQDRIPGVKSKNVHQKYKYHVKLVRYLSLKKERIVWQFIPWLEIIKNYDVVFIQGNPRVLSDLIFGTLLKVIRRDVVLWAMVRSYRGNYLTEKLRLLWYKLFDYIFVYTDEEKKYLQHKGFYKKHIIGMNNGLDQKKIDEIKEKWTSKRVDSWKREKGYHNKIIVLSVGRLLPYHRFDLMIRALPIIKQEFHQILWCVVGDGLEKKRLYEMCLSLGVKENVCFEGAIYDEERLAPYFLSSSLFVHPGAIGLSLLHAFGYGLPVVTHNRPELHGPEFGAFKDGISGNTFKYGDAEHLAETIISLLKNPDKLKVMGDFNLKIARENYNVDVMVDRFVKIAKLSAGLIN